MATARIGAITSVNALAANQMKDVDKVLYLYEPYQSPFFHQLYFQQGEGKAKVVINENGKFDWFEDTYYFYKTQLSGSGIPGGSATATNIGLVDKSWINEGDILFIHETQQMVYVTDISNNEIDISTLDGTTELQAATTGFVMKLGSYNHEFATPRTAVSTIEEELSNRCTIFSETVTTTGRRQAGAKYTNMKTHKDEVKKKIAELRNEIERMMMYSTESNTRTVDSKYRVTWGKGFLGFVTSNLKPYSTLTETIMDEYLSEVFSYGSDRRVHHVGNRQLIEMRDILRSRWQITGQAVKEYNLKCLRFETDWGTLDIIRNPRLEGKFVDYGFTVDPNRHLMRYMDNDEYGSRKFRIQDGVEAPGTDGKSTKLLADVGYQLTMQLTCGILYKGVS